MGRRDAGKKARVCSEGTALKRQKGKEESVVVEARRRESREYDECRKDQTKPKVAICDGAWMGRRG